MDQHSVRCPALLLNLLLMSASLSPILAADDIYCVRHPARSAPVSPSGMVIWDRFWIDGEEALIVSARPGRRRAIASLGGTAAAIPAPPPGHELFLITAPRGLDLPPLSKYAAVLLRGRRTALVLASQASADSLAGRGMEIQAVMPPPVPVSKAVRRGASPMRTLAWDARIQAMIDAVDEGSVSDMLGNLSGVNDVTIGGSSYAIETRNSYQAVPIEKATQYCHEYLTGLGLAASYDTYTWNGYTWRNVVGEQYGSASPDSVAVICAHLDDMPAAAVAPGADDNASGSTAVLLAASILKDYQFENTIRYVLFTGEEQGLRGSYYYVQDCVAAGDAIIGALNFDMIAWDSNADTLIEVHCGTTAESGTLGDLLISTISDYSLGLVAQKITSGSVTASDHARFWNAGYPAVLGIEDTWVSPTSDFNPYYHSVDDTRDHCVLSYTTNYVKAAVGTTARLAVPLAATPTPTPTPPWGMVNFQPASSAPAAGYWPDDGSPFGTHGDYGWR